VDGPAGVRHRINSSKVSQWSQADETRCLELIRDHAYYPGPDRRSRDLAGERAGVGWVVFRFVVIPAEERQLVEAFGEGIGDTCIEPGRLCRGYYW
jgi:hypothetical protein